MTNKSTKGIFADLLECGDPQVAEDFLDSLLTEDQRALSEKAWRELRALSLDQMLAAAEERAEKRQPNDE